MPNNREFVAFALRNARENAGLSQQTVADRVGLSRTAIAQIELGNRPVSPDELRRLASVYRRSAADLSAAAEQNDDVLANVLEAAPRLDERRLKSGLQTLLGLCREAIYLESSLGRLRRNDPPHYDVTSPHGFAEAIAQGERTASHERQRLGLGAALPVGNVLDFVTPQGVHVAAMDFPEEVIGIFIRHAAVGTVIISSGKHRASGERFGVLRGYAHALFERERTVVVTTPFNAGELVEVRADAFASAFLLPACGVEAAISGLDKGRPSRQAHAVFGLAANDPIQAESRSTPGSQTLTYLDVANIARQFGTSYPATVYRLLALNVIGKPESKELLRKKHQHLAREFGTLFTQRVHRERQPPAEDYGCVDLKAEVAYLAIEAYRRQLEDKRYLAALASKFQVPELSEARFLELAESVR